MDKSRKLKRYRRKDYTQVVEFPVEIIGRDGVVRRYSFEESVRLYQRRIASADVRYTEASPAIVSPGCTYRNTPFTGEMSSSCPGRNECGSSPRTN